MPSERPGPLEARDSRWLAIAAFAGAALFFTYGFAQRVAPSVMVIDLMRDFAVGGALLGNISAFYYYAYAGLQIPVGVMIDRFGLRRPMVVAALLCALGSFVFAASATVETASLGRLLVGAGAALSWPCVLAVVGRRFPMRRFAMLAGIGQVAGLGGAMLGQAPLGAVVESVGWRATMYGAAALGIVFALLLWVVLREPGGKAERTASTGLLDGLRTVARNPQTWLAAAFGFCLAGPILAFAGLWCVPYLGVVHGLDRAAAAGTTSLMFAGWVVGAPALGALSDRIGRRKPIMIAGAGLTCASMLAVLYVPGLPLPALQALLFVNGMFGSAMFMSFVCGRQHNPAEAAGAAIGIVNMAVMASGAVMQPLIGLLLDLSWSGGMADGARVYAVEDYGFALAVLPAALAAAILIAFVIRDPGRGGA